MIERTQNRENVPPSSERTAHTARVGERMRISLPTRQELIARMRNTPSTQSGNPTLTAHNMTSRDLVDLLGGRVQGTETPLRATREFREELEREVRAITGNVFDPLSRISSKLSLDGHTREYMNKAYAMAEAATLGKVHEDPIAMPLAWKRTPVRDQLGRNTGASDVNLRRITTGSVTKHLTEKKVIEKAVQAAYNRILGRAIDSPIAREVSQNTNPTQQAQVPTPGTSASSPDAEKTEGSPIASENGAESLPPINTSVQDENHDGDRTAPGAAPQSVVSGQPGAPTYVTNFNNYNYAGGQHGAPQAPAAGPANAPAAPHAPGHGHEAAPANAAHGGHEETPEANEALRNRYWEINGKEDAAFAELKAHIDLPDRKEKLAAFERLRNQRKALAEQILAPYGGRDAAMQVARQEIAAEAAERGQNAPTGAEARNALGAIQGRTKAEAARIIAEKTGGNPNTMRRWLSAFVRWPAAIMSGMASGAVGYSFAQTGLAGGISTLAANLGVPAAWMGTLASVPATVGGVAVPFIGGLAIPAIPVVAAALIGVGVWQLGPRKWLGFKTLDDKMDKGWQAKKLYNTMRAGDSQATIDAKYAKIRSRPTWRRMQTIPRIFGTLLGGMAIHDLATLNRGGTAQDLILRRKGLEAYELGKRGATGAWERALELWNDPRVSEWFKYGGEVQPGTVADCDNALKTLRTPEPELTELRNLTNLLEKANASLVDDVSALIDENARLKELERARAAAQDIPTASAPASAPPSEPVAPSHPRVAEAPPVSTPEVTVPEASPLFKLKSTDLSFIVDEKSDVKNIPQGLRRFFDSIGFKGKSIEWLIDTMDKSTYNGNGMRGGQDLMQDLTGKRLRPTAIPDGTTVDVSNYLKKGMNAQNIYARIDASNALTYPEKLSMRALVERLEEVARRGR